MKLRVWIAQQDGDSSCYNLIGKTKKSVTEQLSKAWNKEQFHTLVHIEIEYQGAFDLFDLCTSEIGHRDTGIGNVLKESKLNKS